MEQIAGFQELRHTADWEIYAWAPDLPLLFEQAAIGMYALSGTHLYPEPRITRAIELSAVDCESLLVKFLTELLFLGEQYGLAFDVFDLKIHGPRPEADPRSEADPRLEADVSLKARLHGAPMTDQSKEIKAVTYHQLAIQPGPRGLEVRIVFDV